MPESLFQRVVVPVASEGDALSTVAALRPYADAISGTIIAVHVIEKAGGAPDKASVEQREQYADEIFETMIDAVQEFDITVETEYLYGTDVAKAIIDGAHDTNADSIIFTPRGGRKWVKLLTGDVTTNLVQNSDLPVIVLPDRDEQTDQ